MKDVEDAIRQFGIRIGLPNLKLNADGISELTVGDGLDVFFEKTKRDTEVRLNGVVGTPIAANGETLRALLVANYGGHGTGPAALAMDPVSGEIVLSQLIDVAPLDVGGFAETVETYLKYLKFWTGYLPTLAPEAGSTSRPVASEEVALFRI